MVMAAFYSGSASSFMGEITDEVSFCGSAFYCIQWHSCGGRLVCLVCIGMHWLLPVTAHDLILKALMTCVVVFFDRYMTVISVTDYL